MSSDFGVFGLHGLIGRDYVAAFSTNDDVLVGGALTSDLVDLFGGYDMDGENEFFTFFGYYFGLFSNDFGL